MNVGGHPGIVEGISEVSPLTTQAPATAVATQRLREELAYLKLPAAAWPCAHQDSDGKELADVAIIGAGMFGIAAAVALVLKGVPNIRVFDSNPKGRSGPWTTFARMRTLRSPKDLPGLALGIRALTFRAWYEAVYSTEAWETLYKIPNGIWQNYLDWIAEAFDLPIEHDTGVRSFSTGAHSVTLSLEDGRSVAARRLVIANGRAGTGGAAIPGFIDPALFPERAAHSCDPVDFAALAGRHVAVIGAGSSAWDNAATALEHGAAKVTLYARRSYLPQINKARGYVYPGFIAGWYDLPAADRWAVSRYLDDMPTPPPHETVLRTLAAGQERFSVRFESRLERVQEMDGQVQITLADRTDLADFLIVGTGFRVDLTQAPLFANVADRIALWRDRYQPEPGSERPHLGLYPWLGAGFELRERGRTDGESSLNRVHLLNHAASMSFGSIASDIPAISAAAERLAGSIVSGLFCESFAGHRQFLEEWEVEWELEKTPYFHPHEPR